MFKGILIGDAYGAGFEFKKSMLQYNDGQKYYDHPTHMASDGSGNSLKAGMYTDDTQMSIAVAETLLTGDFTKENFAKHFVECFHRDPRKGYASGFYHFLIEHTDVESFLKDIRPNSEKNGAVMRALPLGYISHPELVLRASDNQASITHNTKIGIDSSRIAALSSYFLIRGGNKDELVKFIEMHIGGEYNLNDEWTSYVHCHGIATIKAAISVVLRTNSMLETLIKAVSFGGDTDSVASIALGLQDCNKDKIDDLPEELVIKAENVNYGLDYCIELDNKLKDKFLK